jgi:hypothetical protein
MKEHELKQWLRAQAIICEREGMIAENDIRKALDQSPAYSGDDFVSLANQLRQLVENLASY